MYTEVEVTVRVVGIVMVMSVTGDDDFEADVTGGPVAVSLVVRELVVVVVAKQNKMLLKVVQFGVVEAEDEDSVDDTEELLLEVGVAAVTVSLVTKELLVDGALVTLTLSVMTDDEDVELADDVELEEAGAEEIVPPELLLLEERLDG